MSNRPAVREAVYQLIDSEIKYAKKWDRNRTGGIVVDEDKSVLEWLCLMFYYLNESIHAACKTYNKTVALENIRKLTGLAVNCMSYHKTPARKEDSELIWIKDAINHLPHHEISHLCSWLQDQLSEE